MADNARAAIQVASSVVKAASRVFLGTAATDVVGTVSDLVGQRVGNILERRRAVRLLDECVDMVAAKFVDFLTVEYRGLPAHELEATLLSVSEVLDEGSATLTTLVNHDLDARLVFNALAPISEEVIARNGLGYDAAELHTRLLRESCAYLVEVATTLPGFTTKALAELLRRSNAILDALSEALTRLPASRSTDDFTTDYLRTVVNKLDRMELFGLDLREGSHRYPLSAAYVGLRLSHDARNSVRVEEALGKRKHVVVTGVAGSGKTTLLRWLAVASAREDFTGALAGWNDCVPFYIPLRQHMEKPLPEPQEFLHAVGRNFASEMPSGWVHGLLRRGNALVLVDGLDELPEGTPRDAAYAWLGDLIADFPYARYVVSSRPPAVDDRKLDARFTSVELQAMTLDDVSKFVKRWHEAVRKEVNNSEDREKLQLDERAFLVAIESDRHLRALTVNPLLCAMLCALNRQRRGRLPTERMEVYSAALKMLLRERDKQRGITSAGDPSFESKLSLLQEFAFWLVRQGLAFVDTARAEEVIERKMPSLSDVEGDPSAVLRQLVERSGLLREPSAGTVDFVHRSFQEHLAGKAAVENDEIGLLLNRAQDRGWRDVIIAAAGHAQPRQRAELMRGLLDQAGRSHDGHVALLTVACLSSSSQLDPELREEVEVLARRLVPPRSFDAAESLAAVGDLVVDVLSYRKPRAGNELLCSVRLLSLLGTDNAMMLLGELVDGQQGDALGQELMRAWRLFDREQYGRKVVSKTNIGPYLDIHEADVLPYVEHLRFVQTLRVDVPTLASLVTLGPKPRSLTKLIVTRKPRSSIRGVERWRGLKAIEIHSEHIAVDLEPLAELTTLADIRIAITKPIAIKLALAPLLKLPGLATLDVECEGVKSEVATFTRRYQEARRRQIKVHVNGIPVLERSSSPLSSILSAPSEVVVPGPTAVPVLSWPAVNGAHHYVVYRDGAKIGVTNTADYTDATATVGPHRYSVAVVDLLGGESAQSRPTDVTVY